MVQGCQRFATPFVGVDQDVVANPVGRKKTHHGSGRQPFLRHQGLEHRLGICEQCFRLLADDRVVEDFWVAACQFPGVEERGPVDEIDQFGQWVAIEGLHAQQAGFGRRVVGPVGLEGIGLGLGEVMHRRLGLAPTMMDANLLIFGADAGDVVVV